MSRVPRAVMIAMISALAALIVAAPVMAQESGQQAQVRVAHLSPDAPNVDVYLNGEPVDALQNVPFGTVSSYLPVPAGSQQVTVYPAGDTSQAVIDTSVDLAAGGAYTIGAVGSVAEGTLQPMVYQDDLTAPGAGNAKVRAVHAVPGAGAVDVATTSGATLVEGLEFPNASPYAEVPADAYTVLVQAAGTDQTLISQDATLESGVNYSAFATGSPDAGNLQLILAADSAPDTTLPDSGGISPVTLVSGTAAALLLAGGVVGFFALRNRGSQGNA